MSQLVVLSEYSPAIVTLTLNRPERRNAFSSELLEQFTYALNRIENAGTYRVVILRGVGKMFCGGLDLAEAAANTTAEELEQAKDWEKFAWRKTHTHKMATMVMFLLLRLRRMSQIVICAPQGYACGGGGGLVAASDLVVAADDFKIMFPELKRGLHPALLFPLLRRKLSDSALRWMVLTGQSVDAWRAREFGLVHEIVKPESLEEATLSLAREVCSGEPETVRFAKRQMQSPGTDCDYELFKEEMYAAVVQHTQSWFSAVAQEGVAAFLEKRPPDWTV